jgi:hypothetical protein
MEIAKAKMTEAAGILPGEYFIFDQKTGERLFASKACEV